MNRPAILGLLALLLVGAAVAAAISQSGSTPRADRAADPGALASRTGRTPPGRQPGPSSALARKVRGLPLHELRAAFPDKNELAAAFGKRDPYDETSLLFRRLGELHGAGAFDEIIERYGANSWLTARGMTFATLGWMEVDQAAALDAFRELTTVAPKAAAFGSPMSWKGQNILSGLG